MTDQLSGKTIAFLVASEGIEQVELTEPWKAVEQAGGKPELLSLDDGDALHAPRPTPATDDPATAGVGARP